MKICEICRQEFLPASASRPARYCGAVCRNTGNSRVSAQARGAAQRGRGTKWYVKQNGRHQHRIVAEHLIGRPLLPGEVVHHLDGNKKNNHPDNLQVMSRAEHMRAHGLAITGQKRKGRVKK